MTEWRDDSNVGLELSEIAVKGSVDVASVLTMNGGTFLNNGSLSVESINMNGGSRLLGDGATLELMLGSSASISFGDAGEIALADSLAQVSITLVVSEMNTYSARSLSPDFILADGNTEGVDSFYALLQQDNVTVTFKDAEGTTLTEYSLGTNADGQLVASKVVPEPTTATLSLLALAALAGRRRRK